MQKLAKRQKNDISQNVCLLCMSRNNKTKTRYVMEIEREDYLKVEHDIERRTRKCEVRNLIYL